LGVSSDFVLLQLCLRSYNLDLVARFLFNLRFDLLILLIDLRNVFRDPRLLRLQILFNFVPLLSVLDCQQFESLFIVLGGQLVALLLPLERLPEGDERGVLQLDAHIGRQSDALDDHAFDVNCLVLELFLEVLQHAFLLLFALDAVGLLRGHLPREHPHSFVDHLFQQLVEILHVQAHLVELVSCLFDVTSLQS